MMQDKQLVCCHPKSDKWSDKAGGVFSVIYECYEWVSLSLSEKCAYVKVRPEVSFLPSLLLASKFLECLWNISIDYC
jgi:hypothetical protein